MPSKSLERLLRRRFALPLLIVGVALLMLASELTYQRTVHTLRGGISLTDARIATARVLQLQTDIESGQRGFLLTGRAEYLDTLKRAKAELPQVTRAVTDFFDSTGGDGHAEGLKMLQDIATTLAGVDKTIALWAAGDRSAALTLFDSGTGRRLTDDLRELFEAKLNQARNLQENARGVIYSALWLNRLVVAALSIMLMVGLYLHQRQLRLSDRERAERQQALESQVRERTTTLRTVAGYLQTAREDEKSRLARELHDELGGILTAGKLTLARIKSRATNDPKMTELLEQVSNCLSEGIALKRKIIEDLRPSTLTTLGLPTALRILSRETCEQLGIPVHADIAECHLSPEAELGIFRLVQEALTNISKYAHASEVWVRLTRDGSTLQVEIADNGQGFDTATLQVGSHGLAGMRFRIESLGGTLTVVSGAGQGTVIQATLSRQATQTAAVPPDESPPAWEIQAAS